MFLIFFGCILGCIIKTSQRSRAQDRFSFLKIGIQSRYRVCRISEEIENTFYCYDNYAHRSEAQDAEYLRKKLRNNVNEELPSWIFDSNWRHDKNATWWPLVALPPPYPLMKYEAGDMVCVFLDWGYNAICSNDRRVLDLSHNDYKRILRNSSMLNFENVENGNDYYETARNEYVQAAIIGEHNTVRFENETIRGLSEFVKYPSFI